MSLSDTLSNTSNEAQRRQKILMNKFALTGSMESDVVSENEDKTFSSEPFTSFYFCSGNALTIGYGVKIEYKDGELCKEGLEVLADLDIHRNGKSLSMDEKEALTEALIAAHPEAVKERLKASDGILKVPEALLTSRQVRHPPAVILYGLLLGMASKYSRIFVSNGKLAQLLNVKSVNSITNYLKYFMAGVFISL